MEKIDFLKKGITDFFPNFFITFSKVQRNIFNEKSHSDRKTNLKVDLVSCASVRHTSLFFVVVAYRDAFARLMAIALVIRQMDTN